LIIKRNSEISSSLNDYKVLKLFMKQQFLMN